METVKYLVEFWGGSKNGAAGYYNKFSTAKAQATKHVNQNQKNHSIGGGRAYAEIYYIQRLPKFKLILVRTII